MRVVVDTNVLVSGIINPHGAPGQIVDAIVNQALTVLLDDRILSEYRSVLVRPFLSFREADVHTLLDFIVFAGEHILARRTNIVFPGRTDLPFLEVAITGAAAALITGNMKHFRPTVGNHSIKVCAPADFLRTQTQI